MYNFNDDEEEEDTPTKEKVEENEQLKEKMKQIRLKMDKLNISKKVMLYNHGNVREPCYERSLLPYHITYLNIWLLR